MDEDKLKLSNSTIRTFKRCRRHWYLAYYLQYGTDPVVANPVTAATLGTRVHLALEAHYGYELDALEALGVAYRFAIQENPRYEEELDHQHSYARAMVSGYLQWAAEEGIDADTQVIATEELIERDIILDNGEPVTLMAKLDQKVRRAYDGAIRFRDFKTVGTLTKAHLLSLDEQMRFYSLLETLDADEAGERADGGLYSMILRSKRTPKASGPFFRQIEVRYNNNDHASMMARVRSVVTDMRDTIMKLNNGADHRAVVYPNPGDYCGWGCPFTLICPMMDDGSRWEDALRANFVKHDPYGYYGSGLIDRVRAALTPGMTDGE